MPTTMTKMTAEINIPFGYKRIFGQLQKGDGIWDGTRFRKVRKEYPFLGERIGVAIRRCEVVQEALPLQTDDTFDA